MHDDRQERDPMTKSDRTADKVFSLSQELRRALKRLDKVEKRLASVEDHLRAVDESLNDDDLFGH